MPIRTQPLRPSILAAALLFAGASGSAGLGSSGREATAQSSGSLSASAAASSEAVRLTILNGLNAIGADLSYARSACTTCLQDLGEAVARDAGRARGQLGATIATTSAARKARHSALAAFSQLTRLSAILDRAEGRSAAASLDQALEGGPTAGGRVRVQGRYPKTLQARVRAAAEKRGAATRRLAEADVSTARAIARSAITSLVQTASRLPGAATRLIALSVSGVDPTPSYEGQSLTVNVEVASSSPVASTVRLVESVGKVGTGIRVTSIAGAVSIPAQGTVTQAFTFSGGDAGDYVVAVAATANCRLQTTLLPTPLGALIRPVLFCDEIARASGGFTIVRRNPLLETVSTNPGVSDYGAQFSGGPGTCSNDKFLNLGLKGYGPPWNEWQPILAPDVNVVASGQAGFVHLSGGVRHPESTLPDVPLAHPFGIDPGATPSGDPWLRDANFYFAPDLRYSALLADGNTRAVADPAGFSGPIDPDYVEASNTLQGHPAVIGVETDQNLEPAGYRPHDGDRVAILGRWIVDCGHTDYHSEIHPPLVVAAARATAAEDPTKPASDPASEETFTTLIGRAFLIRQTYDTPGWYADEPLAKAAWHQLWLGLLNRRPPDFRVNVDRPFVGTQEMTYLIAPPTPRALTSDRLDVQYHLVVRPGVRVEMTPTNTDQIAVHVTLDGAKYTPPPLPEQHTCTYSVLELLDSAGKKDDASTVTTLFPQTRQGVKTTCYDALPPPPAPESLPRDQTIAVDPTQPFPVYGFVSVRWIHPASPPPPRVPGLSIGDASVVEGNSGNVKVELAVTLSEPSAQRVSVDYRTQDGSASSATDYDATSGTLSFDPGVTQKKIAVEVRGDTEVEPDETFTVRLANPVSAHVTDGIGVITIVNDDTGTAPPPPPPPLPDLIVSSIDSLGPDGEVFTVCRVTFTITNQGDGAAGASTALVYTPTGINTVSSANVSTPALSAGQSVQESGVLNVPCEDIGALTVTADANDAVAESDEGNNSLHKTF